MIALSSAVRNSMTGMPVEMSPGVWEASFTFDADFSGFDGHFPGDPMLPGIAQIMAVAFTASQGRALRITRVGRSKFMRMVRPGETMRVRAVLKPCEAGLAVTGDCATGTGPCAQIKLVLEPSC